MKFLKFPSILSLAIAPLLLTGCVTMTPAQRVAQYTSNEDVPIVVTGIYRNPNRIDGVSVRVGFINTSQSTYKYVRMKFSARNKVGDPVASEIGNKYVAGVEFVGPFKYGDEVAAYNSNFPPLWYNSTITCVVLEEVEVVLQDNTTKTFDFEKSKKLAYKGRNKGCEII